MFTSYYLGICPNNLNGNHIAWCHSIQIFDNRASRDAAANILADELSGTCDMVYTWEEDDASDVLVEDSLTTMDPGI